MRLIDADAFDTILENGEIEAKKQRKYVLASALNTVRGNLAKQSSVSSSDCSELPNGWRPVSKETNPSTSGWYIVTCPEEMTASNERFSGIAEYNAVTGEWFDMDEPTDCYLAWMPLPPPYQPTPHCTEDYCEIEIEEESE